jgi:hypothetical protein
VEQNQIVRQHIIKVACNDIFATPHSPYADWRGVKYREQNELGVGTDLTAEEYRDYLTVRQAVRARSNYLGLHSTEPIKFFDDAGVPL